MTEPEKFTPREKKLYGAMIKFLLAYMLGVISVILVQMIKKVWG